MKMTKANLGPKQPTSCANATTSIGATRVKKILGGNSSHLNYSPGAGGHRPEPPYETRFPNGSLFMTGAELGLKHGGQSYQLNIAGV